MEVVRVNGFTWLGIGAQRCGTTWFTDVLLQHPEMHLNRFDQKELHLFDQNLRVGTSTSNRLDSIFDQPNSGEFTPAYLRCPWVPCRLRDFSVKPLLIVLLRDPVDRFESAMRLYLGQGPEDQSRDSWLRDKAIDSLWGGKYADHLRCWESNFSRDQFLVFQYEAMAEDPSEAAKCVWRRLGLDDAFDPVPLGPSQTTSIPATYALDESLRHELSALYRNDLEYLSGWGIDTGRWEAEWS
jgi:hypothetical protein